MNIQNEGDYYLASGRSHGRTYLAEGTTRTEAHHSALLIMAERAHEQKLQGEAPKWVQA